MPKKTQKKAELCPHKKIVLPILVTLILAIPLTAGAMYFYLQSSKLDTADTIGTAAQTEITRLEDEIELLKVQNESFDLGETDLAFPETTTIIKTECPNDNLNLPVISYSRAGLLTDSDRLDIEEKLIEPFIDYYKDMPDELISMDIVVPMNDGEEYEITTLFVLNDFTPRQEFSFGIKGENYDYWIPECMNGCEFSPAFTAKYPQIVR